MTKTTRSILTSLLLSGALAVPSLAGTHRVPHIPLRFLGGHYMPHAQHASTATALHHAPPTAIASNFTVYSEPNGGDTFGYGINARGDVAGEYTGGDGHTHGFLRDSDGNFTEIQVDTNPTGAFWLNDKDAVTGTYLAGGILHAYLRTPNGKYKNPLESQDSQLALGLHINNKGVATGYYVDPNGVGHGFVRAKDGTLTLVDDPNAATGPDQGTNAGATNVHGDTTGPYFDADYVLHGFVRHRDDTYEEFDVPGALNTIPFIINAKGWVVGLSDEDTGATHGFIRKPNGEIIPVDVQGAGNGPGQGTVVQDMTKAGIAVGNYVDANDVSHGFVRSKDGTIATFDVPECAGGAVPVSINAHGTISGFSFDENGTPFGFVGTP